MKIQSLFSIFCMTVIAVLLVSITSCGLDTRVTSDGCILAGQTLDNGSKIYTGICNDERKVVQWDAVQQDGSTVEIRYTKFPNGNTQIEYRSDTIWLTWDEKSGVQIGQVPLE